MIDIQEAGKNKSSLRFLTLESEHMISTLWEQDGCDKICSKEELWQASQAFEMAIPMKEGDEEVPATESQYEERFWRRRLDGIALDTVRGLAHLGLDVYA